MMSTGFGRGVGRRRNWRLRGWLGALVLGALSVFSTSGADLVPYHFVNIWFDWPAGREYLQYRVTLEITTDPGPSRPTTGHTSSVSREAALDAWAYRPGDGCGTTKRRESPSSLCGTA